MGYAIIIPDVSFADAGLGTVTPVKGVPLESLSISCDMSYSTVQLTALYTPSNTTEKGVAWSIESGSEYASIDSSTGLLTILSTVTTEQNVVVKAVSTSNSSIIATKEITVKYREEETIEDEGYFANLLSDGTYQTKDDAPTMFMLSTLKREVSGTAITISYPSFTIGTATGSDIFQIKIGEYDSSNNFVKRQALPIETSGGEIEFSIDSTTSFIVICIQMDNFTSANKEASSHEDFYNNLAITSGVESKYKTVFDYSKLKTYGN